MLRLSVALEEWLKIGEDINIVFLGMNEYNAKIMIDAPKDVVISRGRAREKYLSEADYKKEKDEVKKKIWEETDEVFLPGTEVELPLWIMEEDRRYANYAIYGKGKLARDCYNTVLSGGTQNILAYVNPQRTKYDCNVRDDEEGALLNPEIDYIVIAVPDKKSYHGYLNKLREMGIPKKKIYWASKT